MIKETIPVYLLPVLKWFNIYNRHIGIGVFCPDSFLIIHFQSFFPAIIDRLYTTFNLTIPDSLVLALNALADAAGTCVI